MPTTNNLFRPLAIFFILCISLIACRSTKDKEPSLPKDLAESIPFDFKTLQEAPSFDWADQTDSAWSLKYEGELFNDKPTEVFAYYASPATLDKNRSADDQYPGIVLIHGGGGTAFRVWVLEWAKRGYSAIAMDLGGSKPAPMSEQEYLWSTKSYRLESGGPNQNDHHKFYQINEDFNQQWQFHALSNIIRAHSLLISFPETDDELTAVTGISWGGYLTSIVSGIDHRFDFSVPVYGCGFLYEESAWLQRFDSLGTEASKKWIQYWDPSKYIASSQMPMLFVNGTNDFAYPVESWQKSLDLAPTVRQLLIPQMRHNHEYGAKPAEIAAFMKQKGNFPQFSIPKKDGTHYTSEVKTTAQIHTSQLVYTQDTSPNKERKWETIPATLEDNNLQVEGPENIQAAYFLITFGEDSLRVSSPVVFR